MIKKTAIVCVFLPLAIFSFSCKTTNVQDGKPSETFFSDEAAAFFNKGVDYHNEEKYGYAVDCFSEAIKISRSYQSAYSARGSSYYFLGKYSEAMSDFDYAISLGPRDISWYALAYFMKGRIYNERGEYEKAVENYNISGGIMPFSAEKYGERSYAYFHFGRMAEAFADMSMAIYLSPSDYGYLDSRGAILYEMKLYKKAIKDFSDSLVLNPGNAHAATCIGTILKELEIYDVSLEYYNKAVGLDPEHVPAYQGRGGLYVILAELSDDINEKNEYLEKSKNDFKKVR